jgi:hypothetical protein
MNCCVGNTKRKYALDRPIAPKIWPLQVETNLTQDEIKSLEEARFVLNKQHLMFPQSLFEGKNSIPINRPLDEMSWPTSHNCNAIHRTVPFKMLNLHYNQWEVGQLLETTINPPLEVPPLRSR